MFVLATPNLVTFNHLNAINKLQKKSYDGELGNEGKKVMRERKKKVGG